MFRPQYPVLKVRRRRSPDAQGDTLHRRVPSVKGFSRKFSRAPAAARAAPRPLPGPARLLGSGTGTIPRRRPRRGREGAVSTESRQTGGAARAGCGARGAGAGALGARAQAGCGAGGCGGAGALPQLTRMLFRRREPYGRSGVAPPITRGEQKRPAVRRAFESANQQSLTEPSWQPRR